MSIGVYGHPSHEISKYTLLVSEIIVEDDTFFYDQVSKSTYKDRYKVSSYMLIIFLLCYVFFINILFYYFREDIFHFLLT